MRPEFIIDVHCHTFNAEDLPMYGFLKKTVLPYYPDLNNNLIKALARFGTIVANYIAPGYWSEVLAIESLIDKYGIDKERLQEVVNSNQDVPEGDEPTEEDFISAVTKALQIIDDSDNQDDSALFNEIIESAKEKGKELKHYQYRDIADWLVRGDDQKSNVLNFIYLLLRYRYKITRKHISTFCNNGLQSCYLCPLLIDFDNWVGSRANTNYEKQLYLMALNNKLHEGSLFPFFPFDPWRALESHEPLEILEKAIHDYGFVGIKLYPPMGFRPCNNSELTQSEFPPNAPFDGEQLDNILYLLYDYCLKYNISITTHCSRSNGTVAGYADRAHPVFWRKLINTYKYSSLSINLGHAGGSSWFHEMIETINERNNIYCDLSYWSSALLEDQQDTKMLIAQIKNAINANPLLKERMMFGTDALMLAQEPNYEKYFERLLYIYSQVVDGNIVDINNFFYGNAIRFLGLEKGNPSRKRLERYYEKKQIEPPTLFDII